MSKEIGQLVKSLGSFSDGQLRVLEVDWDESQWITLEVKPNAGPYKGGAYQFKIEPLDVTTLTPLLHPNINSRHDKVCITFDEAADSHGLELSVIGLMYILQEPNYDDAYGYWTFGKNGKEAYRNIRISLTGRKMGGFEGPRYIEDDDEILRFLKEMKREEEEKKKKEQEDRENEASRNDEGEDIIESDEEESEGDAASLSLSQENTVDHNPQAPSGDSQASNSDINSETAQAEEYSASNEATPYIETGQSDPEPSTSTGARSDFDTAGSNAHADILPTFASLTIKDTQLDSPEL